MLYFVATENDSILRAEACPSSKHRPYDTLRCPTPCLASAAAAKRDERKSHLTGLRALAIDRFAAAPDAALCVQRRCWCVALRYNQRFVLVPCDERCLSAADCHSILYA